MIFMIQMYNNNYIMYIKIYKKIIIDYKITGGW